LSSKSSKPVEFIEPFAGGGIVSLTVAFEELADRITMVELDEQVASVWQTILGGDGAKLSEQIVNFVVTPESVATVLGQRCTTPFENAFRTIVRNRVSRGGILAPGAGLVKYGENGKGLVSRWYPATLRKRILDIASIRDRISFIQGDGLEVVRKHLTCANFAFFMDPPYTAAGKKAGSRLYTHAILNHDELFRTTSALEGDFLMTYDNTPEIDELAKWYGLDTVPVAMKNTHHAYMTELLIGRDLEWIRKS
jgi:DNA adenine methylase